LKAVFSSTSGATPAAAIGAAIATGAAA